MDKGDVQQDQIALSSFIFHSWTINKRVFGYGFAYYQCSLGIGITPTLSLMLSYAGKKRINIIWMCRDAGLIEYFLHKLDIFTVTKNSFALIYYTGNEVLVLPKNLPLNFFIFQYRPNLEQVSLAKGLPGLELYHSFSNLLLLSCFSNR